VLAIEVYRAGSFPTVPEGAPAALDPFPGDGPILRLLDGQSMTALDQRRVERDHVFDGANIHVDLGPLKIDLDGLPSVVKTCSSVMP